MSPVRIKHFYGNIISIKRLSSILHNVFGIKMKLFIINKEYLFFYKHIILFYIFNGSHHINRGSRWAFVNEVVCVDGGVQRSGPRCDGETKGPARAAL